MRIDGVKRWVLQVLIALDQLANVALFFGWADETISARCWRLRERWPWRWARVAVDRLFGLLGDVDHCRTSYESERAGSQLPTELRR